MMDTPGLDLFHRTTSEAASQIMAQRAMVSRENTREVYFSNRVDGQTDGYGDAIVHLRVPEHIAQLDDEFPDGEQHYKVAVSALLPEHFIDVLKQQVAGNQVAPPAPSQQVHRVDEVAPSPEVTSGEATRAEADDPPATGLPAGGVDLDLARDVAAQAAPDGRWTQQAATAAQDTIQDAVRDRQHQTAATQVNALTARINAGPVAVPVRVRDATAHQRAVAAQMWDDGPAAHDQATQRQT